MRLRFRRVSELCVAGLAAACSNQSTGPIQPAGVQQNASGSTGSAAGFTYRVVTTLADGPASASPLLRPTVTTTATLRNDRPDSAVVSYGACNVSLVAHRAPDRQGAPVWRSWASEPWEGTYGRGCAAILIQKKIAPGAELSLGSYSSRVIEILGDSLPDGRYYFTATVAAGAPGGVTLPAGEFDLMLARPPLPDSRTHDFITYKATTNVSEGAGSTVRANVTATLTDAGGSLVEFPRQCAIELVAYRARDRRDAAPRSGAPDWRESRSCASGWQQTILNRGQSISFETAASARDILGSALPEGTYFFAVVVHTRTRHVWLSAGSAELRR
jgi:hypothetical protein